MKYGSGLHDLLPFKIREIHDPGVGWYHPTFLNEFKLPKYG